MQDEVSMVAIRMTATIADELLKIGRAEVAEACQRLSEALSKLKSSEKSMQELIDSGSSVVNTEPISNDDVKAIKKELKNYGVDFHVEEIKGSDKAYIWFKAKDVKLIEAGVNKYLSSKLNEKGSIDQTLDECGKEAEEFNKAHAAEKDMTKGDIQH